MENGGWTGSVHHFLLLAVVGWRFNEKIKMKVFVLVFKISPPTANGQPPTILSREV
jgi:hypothetical protein